MKRLLALAACTFTQLMGAQDTTPLPQEIPPTDKRLHYVARLDPRDPAGPRFDWSGSAVVARFEGAAITALPDQSKRGPAGSRGSRRAT